MKNFLLVFGVLFFLTLGCSSSNSDTTGNIRNRSVEEQLVFLDTNKAPKPDDANVKRASYLLNYLAQNTTSSQKEIGDITTATVEIIKNKYGKEYKHIDVLEGGKRIIDAIPPEKRGKKDDFKTVAYLITLEASTK